MSDLPGIFSNLPDISFEEESSCEDWRGYVPEDVASRWSQLPFPVQCSMYLSAQLVKNNVLLV